MDERCVIDGRSLEGFLPDVRAPILVIQSADDPYGTLRQLDAIEAGCGGPVERLVLEDCGHAPHRDRPDARGDRSVRAGARRAQRGCLAMAGRGARNGDGPLIRPSGTMGRLPSAVVTLLLLFAGPASAQSDPVESWDDEIALHLDLETHTLTRDVTLRVCRPRCRAFGRLLAGLRVNRTSMGPTHLAVLVGDEGEGMLLLFDVRRNEPPSRVPWRGRAANLGMRWLAPDRLLVRWSSGSDSTEAVLIDTRGRRRLALSAPLIGVSDDERHLVAAALPGSPLASSRPLEVYDLNGQRVGLVSDFRPRQLVWHPRRLVAHGPGGDAATIRLPPPAR
jgi:hypothetical protein